jgi:hypothetical protein
MLSLGSLECGTPARQFRHLPVRGRPAHTEETGDGGEAALRADEWVVGVADLRRGHRRGPPQVCGAGGLHTLLGFPDEECADELGQGDDGVAGARSQRASLGSGVEARA